MNTTPGPEEISRRRVAKGAAWSVPAIAIVAASPAYAASGALDAPNVSWSRNADCTVRVSWSPVAHATSYEVQYKTNPGGAWLPSTPLSTTSTATSVPTNATNVRVRAKNTTQVSDWTEISGITVATPTAPTGVTATRPTGTTVLVSWNPVAGAASYEVQIRFFGLFWGGTQSVTGTSTTINDGGLGTGARVRAVGCNGLTSGWTIASGANALARDATPSEDSQKGAPSDALTSGSGDSQKSTPSESPQSVPSNAGTSVSGDSQASTPSDAETSSPSD